jgi:hypothetical protein
LYAPRSTRLGVPLVLDPGATGGVGDRHVDGEEATVGVDELPGDDDVDELGVVRDDAHRAHCAVPSSVSRSSVGM